jgi:hypothetical protein
VEQEGDLQKLQRTQPRLFDTVKLAVSVPSLGLKRGMVGAIVAILKQPDTYRVEFCDKSGRPFCETALEASQFTLVRRGRDISSG